MPFIVLIIVHLMPKMEWMFTDCVLEDSKLVQLLDVGIDKVFPWIDPLSSVVLDEDGSVFTLVSGLGVVLDEDGRVIDLLCHACRDNA